MSDQTETVARALSEDDLALYIAKVKEHGLGRRKNFGRDFKEDDYISGAAVVFDSLGTMAQLPPAWIFGLMSGRSPLGIESKPRTFRCTGCRCTQTEVVEDEQAEAPDGWPYLALPKSWSSRHDTYAFCSVRCLRTFAARSLNDEPAEDTETP